MSAKLIGVGVDARRAGELALIQVGRQRLGVDLAAGRLDAEVHLLELDVRRDQLVDLQVALQIEPLQRRKVDRLFRLRRRRRALRRPAPSRGGGR